MDNDVIANGLLYKKISKKSLEVFVINVGADVVVNTLCEVKVVVITDVVSDIDLGEVLAGVETNVLVVTAMTAFMSAS